MFEFYSDGNDYESKCLGYEEEITGYESDETEREVAKWVTIMLEEGHLCWIRQSIQTNQTRKIASDSWPNGHRRTNFYSARKGV